MSDRRFGKFSLSVDLIDRRPDLARQILRDVIVLNAVPGLEDYINYTGLHPSFDFVPIGSDIPQYVPEPIEGRVHWSRQPFRPEPKVNFPFPLPDGPEVKP
jgi:hypothetical protein